MGGMEQLSDTGKAKWKGTLQWERSEITGENSVVRQHGRGQWYETGKTRKNRGLGEVR